MSDPTVSAFLTKVLCKNGGRLPRTRLPTFLKLSSEQIEQILQEEPQKFPQDGEMVLARSPVRICAKYMEDVPEKECDKLHLCRHYLQGKCKRRRRCTFSHDILSDQNRTVLKANEISGLNEDEIKVLLLQNDNQLLPEVCWKYLQDSCDLGKDCSHLHICRFFTRGECNFRSCKFSHHLLEFGSDLLLTRCQMSEETIENFQMICTVKHEERLQTEGKKGKGQPGAQRGRGRGRPRNREKGKSQDGTLSLSKGQRQGRAGFHSQGRSNGRLVLESGESHLCCSGEEDDSDEALISRILNDWLNSPPGKSSDQGDPLSKMMRKYPSSVQPRVPSGTRHSNPTVYTSYMGDSGADLQSTLPATSPKVSPQPGLPSAPQTKPISGGLVNTASTSSAGPYKPVHLPTRSPSVADTIKRVSPTVVNPSTASVPFTRPSRLVDSPMKSPSVPQEKPVTPTSSSYSAQPVVTSIKPVSSSATSPSSAPSTSSSRLVDFVSVQWVKPVQPQPSRAPSYAESDKIPEICLSNLWKYCNLGGCCPDMHYNLPYRWQIYKGNDWEDISNKKEIEKCYCDPKFDRVQSIDFVTMRSGDHRVRRLSTVSSVTKPPEYVLTTEWLWYWKDENGDWVQYGQYNVKQVSSTILSSDLENIYLSDPTDVHTFTVGSQHYEINFREMKEKNVLYKTEKDVRRRPKYLSCENVKVLRGSTASPTPQSTPAAAPCPRKPASSPLMPALSPLKTDIYPSTWDVSALPVIGCKRVLIPETSSEFSEIVGSFTKTVSGHVVKNLWRLQNPSLWKKFQRQKEEIKKVNQGQDVKEMRLFHGAVPSHVHIFYNENFDWHICGFHGYGYGQGNYFARDASYADNYSVPQPDGKQSMFVARVLVGDYVAGNQQMTQPPQRPGSTTRFDSCVDDILNPSLFVVFEKHQVYPEYVLEYKKLKKPCVIC